MRRIALDVSKHVFPSGIVSEGIYTFVTGPSYETKAEARFLRLLGGDVVGMSTVPEVLVARHCGMRVLALSLVTNLVVMDRGDGGGGVEKATHEEVLKTSAMRAQEMQAYVKLIVDRLKMIN